MFVGMFYVLLAPKKNVHSVIIIPKSLHMNFVPAAGLHQHIRKDFKVYF